jgi:hypothetical protein
MYTIEELKEKRMSKEELFKGINFSFDHSLPQDWLDEFSNWCKIYYPEITYDIILSTTIWAYTQNNFYGFPVFGCLEVCEKHFYYLRNK